MQTYGGKTCYERYTDGTYRAYSFMVLYAPKPPDYIYTPEERTTFEALTARVDAAIEEIKRRADSGEFTPVKGVPRLCINLDALARPHGFGYKRKGFGMACG